MKNTVIENLLPKPREVNALPKDMVLSGNYKVLVAEDCDPKVRFAGQRLAELISEEFGLKLQLACAENVRACSIVLTSVASKHSAASAKPELGDEGYQIEVDRGVATLDASTPQGLLWAAMTFRQLISRDRGRVLVCGVKIKDRPHYKWRGLMIDSGRAPNSPPKIKRIIRICSSFKLNCVIFREGDDELNAVRYRTNKLGSKNPHAITMDEVKDFVEYADLYGVTVIPEIESLGHSGAKGFHYPDLVNDGGVYEPYEGIGIHKRKMYLNPCDERAYRLLESIYDEWLDIIKGPFLHLGLDEVPIGAEQQAAHLKNLLPLLERVAAKHGREIIPWVWSDTPPTPDAYAEKVIRCIWGYEEHGLMSVNNPHLQEQGIEGLLKTGCKQKVFMAGGATSGHTSYSKGEYEAAFKNLASWAQIGKDHPNWIGILATQWGGNMLDDWLPDFLACAEYGWNPPETETEFSSFMVRIRGQLSRLSDSKNPKPEEMDPPAWDGIWLKGKLFHEDIMGTGTA